MSNENVIHCVIPGSVLRAAACLAANRTDHRTYLRDVCVTSVDGTLYVVATDGGAMAVFRNYRQSLPDFDVLIPTAVIKAIKKSPADDCYLRITHATETDGAAQTVTVGTDGASQTFRPSGDRYPAFLRVIPEAEGAYEHAVFDVALLQRFVDAKKALGASGKLLGAIEAIPRGQSATRVNLFFEPPYGWEFTGVISPMRLA